MQTEEREIAIRTEEQKRTARENGAKSQGPITPEGKKRSSKNALRHGLFAKAIVLDDERKENFTILTRQYRQHFNPTNALEEGLIEEMAGSFWRMRRLWAIETRAMNQKKTPNQNLPIQGAAGDFDPSFGLRPPAADPLPDGFNEDDPDEYIAAMDRITSSFMSLANTPGFRLVLQHQGRLHRDFQRALRSLMQARKEEK